MKFIRRHSSLTDVNFTQALHSQGVGKVGSGGWLGE